jgi:hypothetical protein
VPRDGDRDELGSDATVARDLRHHRVLEPRVHEAVPRHVHEPDETSAITRDDPSEAVAVQLREPIPFRFVEDARVERFRVEAIQLT